MFVDSDDDFIEKIDRIMAGEDDARKNIFKFMLFPQSWKFVLQCDSERGGVPLNYKEAIMELVGKIHSEKILKRIYKFVLYLYTKE